jgi:hypothetical protein
MISSYCSQHSWNDSSEQSDGKSGHDNSGRIKLDLEIDHNRNWEDDMKLDEIKEIAKRHNIKAGKMKKADLVAAIQKAENNDACFETGKADSCAQDSCLWRDDCV